MNRLKTLCRALCLATALVSTAGVAKAASSLSASGGTSTRLSGAPGTFDPNWFGDASMYTSAFDLGSMLKGASLLLTQPAAVTYMLVGFEAGFNNALVSGGERLNNRSGAYANLGSSISFSQVTASPLDFSFLSNGSGQLFSNGNPNTGVILSADRQSALLLFNDAFSGDGDFDDMVVRVTISSVPEPEALAMLLAGLGVVTAVVRRRHSKAVRSV